VWILLFLRYFPGLSLADFEVPNGFPVDLWDSGKALIEAWQKRGV
jgi:hypothetical protein